MNAKRGIILISTLVIMVVFSIFLMTAVYHMQSSVMATKRVIWDIKSYWATEAGNNIAADSCIITSNFPNSKTLPYNKNSEGVKYGDYLITNDNGVIKGRDDNIGNSFSIYTSDSSEMNVSLKSHFNSTKSSVSSDEIYCLTVGQSGPTICATEFIYKVNNDPNTTFKNINNTTINREEALFVGAALFVGDDLDVNVKDFFNILQKDGTRGCIVSGGAVSISSENNSEEPTWDKCGGLSIGDGIIFANDSCKINGKDIPLGDKDNLSKYGVSVYKKPSATMNPPKFKNPENAVDLPSGIWAFMEMPTKDELQKEEFKALCSAVNSICSDTAEADVSQITKFESYLNKNENYKNWLSCDKYTNVERTQGQKAYIASKFNQVFDKLPNVAGQYVPVFLPDKNSGNTPFATRAKLSSSSINSITYSGMIKAFANGVISENKNESETINLGSNPNSKEYVLSTCKDNNNKDFYLLRYCKNDNIKSRIENVGKHVAFSTTNNKTDYLTMTVIGDLESKDSDSFFSFAVFERNPLNFSEEYKKYLQTAGEDEELYSSSEISQLISQRTECYVPANSRRGLVKLGNGTGSENSIIVNKMHIKGSIQGEGNLRSKAKDITFEGVGSGVTSGDNLVSMWAADDIKIYQVSAANSSDFVTDGTKSKTAEFKGILYASDKIRINVGADNLNFNVSGVVISRGGLMEVNGIKNFTITYDPDLSNEVMEKYIAGWTKITDSLAVDTGNANNDNSTVRVGTFKAFNRI